MSSLLTRLLKPEPSGAPSLEDLRQRILQRLLVLMLGICLVLGIRDTLVGYDYEALPVVIATGLGALVAYRYLPRWRFLLPPAVALAVLTAVAVEMRGNGLCVTPSNAFLLVVIPLVTLVGHAGGGWFMTLLAAGLALGQEWRHPPQSPLELQCLNDYLVLLFAGQTVAWIFQRSFWRLQGGLTRQQQALEAVEHENQAMGRPLFLLLAKSLEELESLLAGPGPILSATLAPLVDEIQGAVHQARSVALGASAVLPAGPPKDAFLATRHAFTHVGAWCMAVVVTLSTVPLLFGGHWALTNSLDLGSGLCMLAYLGLFGTRRHPQLTVWVLLLTEFVAVSYRVYFWGPTLVSPATVELPVLVLMVGLAAGYRPAMVACGLGLGLLLAAWSLGAHGPDRLNQDLNVFLCLLAALFGAGEVLGMHGRLSASLSQAVQGLERRLDCRRRILGLLFQDLLQPLSLISLTLEQAEVGLSPEARGRLLVQVRRLNALLKAAQPLMGEPAGELTLNPMRLDRLLAKLRAELEPVLVMKGQRLYADCPEDLRVLSVGELLDAGVLMPLLNNAIRHNPDGASVTLRAREHEGAACVWISDQGPGFPDSVLAALSRGRPVPHGSAGEAGSGQEQGLGLDRAWDYSNLLGGQLSIYNRVEGGAVAQVRLPLAPAEAAHAG